MDKQRQLEMAARIRECRGRRPQPVIADEVGVRLRTYQHWEEGDGGISWENLEKLAEVHGVTTNWLLYGEQTPGTPEGQLDRIEGKLDELLALALEQELEQAAGQDERPAAGTAAGARGSRKTRRA